MRARVPLSSEYAFLLSKILNTRSNLKSVKPQMSPVRPSKVQLANKMKPKTVSGQRLCLPPADLEPIVESVPNMVSAIVWLVALSLAMDVLAPFIQIAEVRAECPALEEHKVGQLATLFREWTSAKTKQLLKERNETLPDVVPSSNSFENCTLPMAYVLAQQRKRSHDTVEFFNDTQSKVDPNDRDYLTFLRETREKYMTILDVEPADEMSRIVFRNREPRWIDICRARPDRNETWLNIEMGDPPRHHSPAVIEKDRRERGTFIKQVAAYRGQTLSPQAQYELDILSKAETSGTTPSSWTPASYTPKDRRRRSIAAEDEALVKSASIKTAAAYRATVVGHERKLSAALAYKKPASHRLAGKSQWSAKKTTFSFSSPNFIDNRLTQHKKHHSKSRYFVAPAEEAYKPALGLTTTPPPTSISAEEKERIEKRIHELVLSLYQLDIRVSWFHNHALNTLNHVKEHLGELKQIVIAKGAAKVSPDRLEHITDLTRRWFPRLDDLAILNGKHVSAKEAKFFNADGGVYNQRHRTLLLNLTQYVQFFGVALEQMKYDQLNLNVSARSNDTVYKSTDRLLNKLQCETESVMKCELEFAQKRAELDKLYAIHHQLDVPNINDFYHKLVNYKLSRDMPFTGGELESPIARAFAKFTEEQQRRLINKMATYSPEMELRLKLQKERSETHKIIKPRHLWREIMPLEARQIQDPKERAARDLLILDELSPTLDCYESVLLTSFF